MNFESLTNYTDVLQPEWVSNPVGFMPDAIDVPDLSTFLVIVHVLVNVRYIA